MHARLIKPAIQRHVSEDLGGFFTITIPSPRKWYLIAYLTFQILVCIIFEIAGLSLLIGWLLKDPTAEAIPFAVIWLTLFTAGSLVAVYAFLWQVVGKERIEINGSALRIGRNLSWFFQTKEYATAYVKDLRAAHAPRSRAPWALMFEHWGLSGETIAFDYGAKTVRFGIGIEEAEAKQIVAEIQQKFPQYRSNDFSRS